MKLLRFINKKLSFDSQKRWIISFLFVGAPIGIIFTEILSFITLKDKYKFDFGFISVLIFDILITLPFIINYYQSIKKYKKIILLSLDKDLKVKSLFNFDDFKKNESYNVLVLHNIIRVDGIKPNLSDKLIKDILKNGNILIKNDLNYYPFMKIGNRFEIDDIKIERKKKLNRIKKLW